MRKQWRGSFKIAGQLVEMQMKEKRNLFVLSLSEIGFVVKYAKYFINYVA